MQFFIGTSGYDYPEWKGEFYPQDLKRTDFLSFYAEHFNALELNFSFYGMPLPEKMLSFYDRTDGKVLFSVKANQLLTHKIGQDWESHAQAFKAAVNSLLEKNVLGALLFQFPESFHYTNDNRYYLAKLIQAFEGFPVVIEFRHKEWVRESVFAGLEKMKASLCFCDMPRLKNLPNNLPMSSPEGEGAGTLCATPFIGDLAYIRLHGRNADAWYAVLRESDSDEDDGADAGSAGAGPKGNGSNGSARYRYDYSADELSQFVLVINEAMNVGKKVHVYFNNHPCGFGAKNAQLLKSMVELSNLQLL